MNAAARPNTPYRRNLAYTRRFLFTGAPEGETLSHDEGPLSPLYAQEQEYPFPFDVEERDGLLFRAGPPQTVPGDTPEERFRRWALRFVRLAGTRESPPQDHVPRRIVVVTFDPEPYRASRTIGEVPVEEALLSVARIFDAEPWVVSAGGFDSSRINVIHAEDAYPAHMAEAYFDPESWPHTWIMDAAALEQAYAAIENFPPPPIVIGMGGETEKRGYYAVYPGTLISALPSIRHSEGTRVITGGLLTGRVSEEGDWIRPLDRSVAVLRVPAKRSFLWWLNPGLSVDSISPTFLSWLLPRRPRLAVYALLGERRSCISCGYCRDVCPLGLDPEYLFRQLSKGHTPPEIVSCMGCNLCSYVCPAKIDLGEEIYRHARSMRK